MPLLVLAFYFKLILCTSVVFGMHDKPKSSIQNKEDVKAIM